MYLIYVVAPQPFAQLTLIENLDRRLTTVEQQVSSGNSSANNDGDVSNSILFS